MNNRKEIRLTDKDFPKELITLKPIIPQILEIVREKLGESTSIRKKSDVTTLTETDQVLEKLLTSTIKTNFPPDAILGEELSLHESRSARRLWAIDPLCGSYNFAAGLPIAATNVALFENQRLRFALVIDHLTRNYYWASEELEGIYRNETKVKPPDLPEAQRVINVDLGSLINKKVPNQEQRIAAFAQIVHDLILEGFEPVNLYSSLSATYAALGLRAASLIPDTNPWDEAAACYLIEKNGGRATDFSGNPPSPSMTSALGSLNPELHEHLLALIQKHWPSE